jgi:hypothetical protein
MSCVKTGEAVTVRAVPWIARKKKKEGVHHVWNGKYLMGPAGTRRQSKQGCSTVASTT